MAIHRLVPAMEMIEFQKDDKFGPRIESLISSIRTNIIDNEWTAKEVKASAEVAAIEKLVFDRMGMRISMQVENGYIAAIMPFYANRNHIFIKPHWHGQVDIEDQTKLLSKLNGKRGTVDSVNAKLGGIFSEYVHQLWMDFHELIRSYNMSPAEMTGILLHELGHGFYACSYSDRVASCNQVLTNIARELSKEPNARKADYVYMELLKINPETTREIAKEMIEGEKVVFGNRAFKYLVDTVLYQMDNGKYDETSFENLADNFAARFNYGRPLISALSKFQGKYDENTTRQIAFWVTTLAAIGSFLLFAACAMQGYLLLAFYLALSSYGLTSYLLETAGEQGRDYTYDDIKVRYKRIRDQLVEQIKQGAVAKGDAEALITAIEETDVMIKDTQQYRSSLDIVMNFLRPANFRAKTSIERQQMLEDLATNRFFVQSLKLQAIA